MDLCPVFKFKSTEIKGTIDAMSLKVQSLIELASPEAILYLIKYMQSDRILPDILSTESSKIANFGFKLFSFAEQSQHFIIKPGQMLGPTEQFKDFPQIKEVYTLIKCLKDVLNVDIPSYLVKKVMF